MKEGKGFLIEYNIYPSIRTEIEYLNGERNGKGKEFDENNRIIFEGLYFNGKDGLEKDIVNIMKLNKK